MNVIHEREKDKPKNEKWAGKKSKAEKVKI